MLAAIDEFTLLIRKRGGKQIGSKTTKEFGIGIIRSYFESGRSKFSSCSSDELTIVDQKLQELHVMLHARCSKVKALTLIASIRKELVRMSTPRPLSPAVVPRDVEDSEVIAETIERLGLPNAASTLRQAAVDFLSNRLSWKGPVTEARECLREVLDHLAPDKDVKANPGFALESGTNGPTMKQKVKFILSKRGYGKAQIDPAQAAVEGIEGIVGSWIRSVYVRASVSTHTAQNGEEAARIFSWVKACLRELLEIRVR